KQRTEFAARAEALKKALEEVRVAPQATKAAGEARLAALKATEEAKSRAKLAALPPDAGAKRSPETIANDPAGLARALQTELKRLGCYAGEADGTWGVEAQSALDGFIRLSKADLPSGPPSKAALEAVTGQSKRVCPPKDRPRLRAARTPRVTGNETGY